MINILCFGDSNTFGFNPEWTAPQEMRFPKDKRWTGILGRMLGEGYEIIEEGLGGRTTAWDDSPTQGRNGLKEIVPLLQTHQPLDLIILMLGTNDAKRVYNASAMEIGRGMEELVKICLNPYVYDIMKTPKVLIISPVRLGEKIRTSWLGDVFDEDSANRVEQLASIYKRIADTYGCGFLDAADVAKVSETDSVHIGMEEHRKLAEAIEREIRKLV